MLRQHPAVGGMFVGHLYGTPAEASDRFTPTVDRWDPDLSLIYFGERAAGWKELLTDGFANLAWAEGRTPLNGPIAAVVTRHGIEPRNCPTITATIKELYETSVQRELRDGAWYPIAGTEQYRAVQTTPKHGPKDLASDESTRRGFACVVLGLQTTSEELPAAS